MKRLPLTLIATTALAAGAASTPAAASADTLLAPAPGAKQLAAGGGYLAWFAPSGNQWRLTLRAPDGAVTTPGVAPFAQPTQVSIGTLAVSTAPSRTLVVTYARADGDVHQLDPSTGRETRVQGLATKAYRESAAVIHVGSYAFVRRGGKRPGVYFRSSRGAVRRITSDTPAELAYNGARVAYAKGNAIVVRTKSGRGRTLVFRAASTPSSPALTRYRVAWLERATGTIRQTPRFAGSGGPYDVRTSEEAARKVPGAQSIVMDRTSQANTFLDAEGVKQAVPPLF